MWWAYYNQPISSILLVRHTWEKLDSRKSGRIHTRIHPSICVVLCCKMTDSRSKAGCIVQEDVVTNWIGFRVKLARFRKEGFTPSPNSVFVVLESHVRERCTVRRCLPLCVWMCYLMLAPEWKPSLSHSGSKKYWRGHFRFRHRTNPLA